MLRTLAHTKKVILGKPNGYGKTPSLMMKPAIPVSLTPALMELRQCANR